MKEKGDVVQQVTLRDHVGEERSARGTRRSTLRTLSATFLALAGGGAAVAEAGKKGKKKGKGKGKSRKTCRSGRIVASLAVPATGGEVFTPALSKGQRYTLRAFGSWSTNATFQCDAVAAFQNGNPAVPHFNDNGVRLGLSLDGRSPDIWGAYSITHTYATSVVGKGRRLSLRMQDSGYTDNSGVLNVDVICG